jgi:hypothetical protein
MPKLWGEEQVFTHDVVIHTNHNIVLLTNVALEATPPVAEHFDLNDYLWIGRIKSGAPQRSCWMLGV